MGKWDDEFAAHPLWNTVEQFRTALDQCPDTDDDGRREHVDRLRRLLVELDARRGIDPVVTSKAALDGVNNGLSTVLGQLSNYVNQPSQWPSYLAPAASQYADQVFAVLAGLPQPARGPAITAAREAARAHLESMEAALRSVQSSAETAIAALTEERGTSTEATQQALAEVESLRTAVAQTESTVAEQVKRIDFAVTTQQSAFETQQSNRADRFQADLEQLREKSDEHLAEVTRQARHQADAERKAADEVIAEIRQLHEDAQGLVEATGRRVVTTEFGEYAAKQDRAALVWSLGAVVVALFGFCFIAYQIANLPGGELSWPLVAYKITASLALLLVAGFCGKQSAGHREQEKQAKRRQLEINALEPFLSRLPEEQAQELRAKMADRILVQPSNDPTTAGSDTAAVPDQATLDAVVTAVRDAFTKRGG